MARRARAAWRAIGALAWPCLALVPAPGAAEPDPPAPPTDADAVEQVAEPVVVERIAPAELPETPTSFTTVIHPDRVAGEGKSVADLIGDAVGVQVRQFGGPGQPSEVSIRGSTGQQSVVLLDGVRLNTAQSGAVDLSTIPVELVERIEISRGGGSVQTGSDAIGGVINIVTRRADGKPAGSASGAGGSFGTAEGSFTQRARFRGTEFVVGYDAFRTDGDWEFQPAELVIDGVPIPSPVDSVERVNNDTENHSALVKVARDLSDRFRVSAEDSFFHGDSGRPGPDSEGGELLGQSTTARQERTRNVANLRFEAAEWSELGLNGEAVVFHRLDRSQFRDSEPRLGPPVETDDRNHSLGGRSRVWRRVAIGPSAHDASLGLEVREDWLVADSQPDRDRLTTGVFVQDDVRFFEERLWVVPALRFDSTEGFDPEWIPRLGIVIQPASWLRFRGNVERAYRVPNFDELYFDEEFVRGDPNLEPEDSLSADVGFELGLAKLGPLADLDLEFAVFRRDVEESIVFQVQNNFLVVATNTGAALVRGLELAGGFRVLRWVAISGNWTLLDTEDESSGNPLPGRPRNEALLRAELGPRSRSVFVFGERHYTSDIPTDAFGNQVVSARTTWNVGAGVDVLALPFLAARLPGRRLLLSAVADNVTDQSVRDALFYPQPGRVLSFRVEAHW